MLCIQISDSGTSWTARKISLTLFLSDVHETRVKSGLFRSEVSGRFYGASPNAINTKPFFCVISIACETFMSE